MPGIGVLVNPHASGNSRRADRVGRLTGIVGESGIVRETQSIAEIADVAREFLVSGPIGAWAFLHNIGRLYRGFPTGEQTLYDNLAREVTIRFTPAATYMVDGDILPAVTELQVTTGPRLGMIRG